MAITDTTGNKDKALSAALAQIERQFGKGSEVVSTLIALAPIISPRDEKAEM